MITTTKPQRATLRKTLIAEVLKTQFADGAVLLEELRWAVLRKEFERKGRTLEYMSDANKKSFARTIREFCPDINTVKVPLTDHPPVGLVARAGVFRLSDPSELDAFLSAPAPTILCALSRGFPVSEPRYKKNRWTTPQYHVMMLWLFVELPTEASLSALRPVKPTIIIPLTTQLTIVQRMYSSVAIDGLAKEPWRLVRFSKSQWLDVAPDTPISDLEIYTPIGNLEIW